MPVVVRLSPLLRKYVQDYDHTEGIQIEQSGLLVKNIVDQLNIPEKMVTSVMVNHRPSKIGYVTQDGDHIFLAMIIGGG